jgi:hypothetical protein
VAPVFLLTGVGSFLGVMMTRLSRAVDRAHAIESAWSGYDEAARREGEAELTLLERRARLANWAINACAASGLLICLVIALLFVDAFLGMRLRWLVGLLFFLAMLALTSGLGFLVREVHLATLTLRIGAPKAVP